MSIQIYKTWFKNWSNKINVPFDKLIDSVLVIDGQEQVWWSGQSKSFIVLYLKDSCTAFCTDIIDGKPFFDLHPVNFKYDNYLGIIHIKQEDYPQYILWDTITASTMTMKLRDLVRNKPT